VKQGVLLSVLSSVLFAGLYYYSTMLAPLDGGAIFSWRVLLALPALALFISRARGWGEVAAVGRRLRSELRLWLLMSLSAILIGAQLWLFVWAPLHQKGLDVSLGYFLLPLAMVVVGRFVYQERLSRIQWLAVAVALVGVAHEFIRIGSFSWATALVVFGYPPYFMLRRVLRIGSLTTLWFDMLFLIPAALWVLAMQDLSVFELFPAFPRLFGLVPLLGLLSAVALICYFSASRLLPLGLFGLLGYLEPVLLFWVAFLFLHEPISPGEWWTYIPIWLAVMLIVAEGVASLSKEGWTRGKSRETARKKTG